MRTCLRLLASAAAQVRLPVAPVPIEIHVPRASGKALAMGKKNFYAVRVGRKPGIYKTWPECQEQTNGYPGAIFKGFPTREEAETFIGSAAPRHPSHPRPFNPSYAHAPRQDRSPSVPREAGKKRSHTTAQDTDKGDGSEEAPANDAHIAILELCRVAARQSAGRVDQAQVNKAPGSYWVHFDGGSRGNPGVGGSGAVITDIKTKAKLAEVVLPLPYGNTNNVAEYCGLIVGLMACVELGVRAPHVKGDSKLVASQINGNYKVNAPHLRPYHAEACALMATLYQGVVARPVEHIPREENGVADELSNQAMDMAAKHLRWRGT